MLISGRVCSVFLSGVFHYGVVIFASWLSKSVRCKHIYVMVNWGAPNWDNVF